ncbi:MAG: SGNH/GDSL hydrolase family protein [Actinomycetota bacterium]|nr:SGNH/GDSL hydrolase family protein [Actinomycetota bacterium]
MTFEYSNLNDRSPGRMLRLTRRLLPGVGLVENEIKPYAEAWHQRNLEAFASPGPLWVVLGDSLSQGVGASSIEHSWVLQAWRALAGRGVRYRIVNLSFSGARVSDVLNRQIPALAGLPAAPELVTVLIGSNDIIKRDLRARLPGHYRAMLSALPKGALVATVPRTRGVQAEVNRLVHEAEDAGAVVAVPLHFVAGARAPDHFHPDDTGYAAIAADFTTAILARQ